MEHLTNSITNNSITNNNIQLIPEEQLNKDVLYFDVETDGYGGFNPPKQNLIQLAWIFNGTRHSYLIKGVQSINPQVPHKITPQMLNEQGLEFSDVWKLFSRDFNKANYIVAHNIAFDSGIISRELLINDLDVSVIQRFKNKCKKYGICTMKETTEFCKLEKVGNSKLYPGYKWPRLTELHQKLFGTEPSEEMHDALNDCVVTERCYLRCRQLRVF